MSADLPTFITCTASHFDQPIADLVVKLCRRPPSGVDLDYVFSAILLSVARFEAYMVRGAYLAHVRGQVVRSPRTFEDRAVAAECKSGHQAMTDLFPTYGKSRLAELEAVYVIRDVLTHNHLWEYRLLEDGTKELLHRLFGGDSKFRRCVDFNADPIRTKALLLPVVPGDQSRETLKQIFAVLTDALQFAKNDLPEGEHLGIHSQVRIPKELSAQLFGPTGGITVRLEDLVAAVPTA